jgi:hypothetical protein
LKSLLLFRITFAGALSALLLWLGIWLAQYADATLVTPQLTFRADRLHLTDGVKGGEAGLSVPPQPPGRPTVVIVAEAGFASRDYSQISWDIPELPENIDLAIVWTSSSVAGKGQVRRISAAERAAGSIVMASEPAWQGQIIQLGILLTGVWTSPVLVRSISLYRTVPAPLDVLDGLWSDWSVLEPWTQRSINFHIGAQRGKWLTPVTTLALWVGTAFLVFILLSRPLPVGGLATGFACLLLMAWFLLDARWQWQLGQRLFATYQTYGGQTLAQKASAAPDGKIFRAVERIREQLPADPVRIIIIHQENSAYLPGRIRYHLLPHRSYAVFSRLPSPEQVRAGDHLLVLANASGIRYDRQGGVLVSDKEKLAVESRLVIPGFGALYRLQGGD